MKKTILAAAAAVFCLAGLFGHAQADKTVPARPLNKPAVGVKAAQHKTVFDMSHSEIFSPLKEGPLNYTSFYDIVKSGGGEVAVNKGPVTRAALSGVRTYVIAGPVMPLTGQEVAALEAFVMEGGCLLVLLHISPPVALLTNAFGIAVTNFTIAEKTGFIEDMPQDFFVTDITAHPVTAGIKKIAVYGTWGLMAEGGATLVARTTTKAWADLNRNKKPDEGEPVQQFGIVAVSASGRGKVVVVADDAPFANRFIDEADNRRLAENIFMWFRQ